MIADVRERCEKVPFEGFSIRTSDGATVARGPIYINSTVEQSNGE
jgi:hypothetical protein